MKDQDWDARIRNLGERLRRKGHSQMSLHRLQEDVISSQGDLARHLDRLRRELFDRLGDQERPCFWQEQQSYRIRLQALQQQQRQLDSLLQKVRQRKPDSKDLAGSYHLTD